MRQISHSLLLDLPKLAFCHHACFPESFSTKLGLSFTAKSLEWFLAGENRFLFHISEDGSVIGYCGGFIAQYQGDGSTSGMMQYAMKEAAIGMLKKPGLFFNKEVIRFYPLIFKNIKRKIFPLSQTPALSQDAGNIKTLSAGLVVIGVDPDFRGKGAFEMLMNHFENEVLKRKITKMNLSVKKHNIAAIKAYAKAGWLTGKEHTESLEMHKELF